jgi:methionine--tRNA ligase beta chain
MQRQLALLHVRRGYPHCSPEEVKLLQHRLRSSQEQIEGELDPDCPDATGAAVAEGLISNTSEAIVNVWGGMWRRMSETRPVPEIGFEDFKKLDARVGTITEVERVPRTEKLYRILVDLGPIGIRQTISSLVGYYQPDQLKGKRVVFLYNLKPTKFAGQVSQGMLLAAEEGKDLALLTIDRELPNGARVT